eukprot:8105143-Pyramimonas_sp.AAC.2
MTTTPEKKASWADEDDGSPPKAPVDDEAPSSSAPPGLPPPAGVRLTSPASYVRIAEDAAESKELAALDEAVTKLKVEGDTPEVDEPDLVTGKAKELCKEAEAEETEIEKVRALVPAACCMGPQPVISTRAHVPSQCP